MFCCQRQPAQPPITSRSTPVDATRTDMQPVHLSATCSFLAFPAVLIVWNEKMVAKTILITFYRIKNKFSNIISAYS
jgi:hypothetical protein